MYDTMDDACSYDSLPQKSSLQEEVEAKVEETIELAKKIEIPSAELTKLIRIGWGRLSTSMLEELEDDEDDAAKERRLFCDDPEEMVSPEEVKFVLQRLEENISQLNKMVGNLHVVLSSCDAFERVPKFGDKWWKIRSFQIKFEKIRDMCLNLTRMIRTYAAENEDGSVN